MAHVLIMAAFQIRHPVTFFIQMKSSDLSLHCRGIAPSQMVLWLILTVVIKRRLRTGSDRMSGMSSTGRLMRLTNVLAI
jgi:hypothetical protein